MEGGAVEKLNADEAIEIAGVERRDERKQFYVEGAEVCACSVCNYLVLGFPVVLCK